jgi:hypothetical protein
LVIRAISGRLIAPKDPRKGEDTLVKKKALAFAALLFATPHFAEARGFWDWGWGGWGNNGGKQHMNAPEPTGIALACAFALCVAGYLLLRRRKVA